ncbi:NAD-dependent epimerase/dehydratase family protein [Longispora sp. K20-0274]|uniref:NAD-dependent epimerase/dehydratase family protein n=1 Tax=Longispora sp. K20-0274 TaxID=3088255 RepID=UPI00399A5073
MDILVIGGSRYFGRLLVDRLLASGARVTLLNRGSAPPPPGVEHLLADRDDEAALVAALAGRTFDVVVDQVCYTPRQAEIARRVITTGRYVMTSTIEVYDRATAAAPLPESAFDAATWPVDPALPWDDPAFREAHYAEGKRQAEAVFAREPAAPFVAVRTGHVVGGADFTGRLAHYTDRARAGEPVVVHPAAQPSSFTHPQEIADFLYFAATGDFTGPVNVRSHGEFSAADLCARLGVAHRGPEPGEEASPFSFDRYYGMSNARGTELGFAFSDTANWLPGVL